MVQWLASAACMWGRQRRPPHVMARQLASSSATCKLASRPACSLSWPASRTHCLQRPLRLRPSSPAACRPRFFFSADCAAATGAKCWNTSACFSRKLRRRRPRSACSAGMEGWRLEGGHGGPAGGQ